MVSTPSSYSTVGVAPVDGRSLPLHLGKELNGIVSYAEMLAIVAMLQMSERNNFFIGKLFLSMQMYAIRCFGGKNAVCKIVCNRLSRVAAVLQDCLHTDAIGLQ